MLFRNEFKNDRGFLVDNDSVFVKPMKNITNILSYILTETTSDSPFECRYFFNCLVESVETASDDLNDVIRCKLITCDK